MFSFNQVSFHRISANRLKILTNKRISVQFLMKVSCDSHQLVSKLIFFLFLMHKLFH